MKNESAGMRRLSDIAASIGAYLKGTDVEFTKRPRIVFDTRTLWQPENTLFWALPGAFRNGEQYVDKAFDLGVKAAVVSDKYSYNKLTENRSLLIVSDTLEALQKLAAIHRSVHSNTFIIAITGSNGKTIVKEWLAQSLEKGGKKVCKSPLSYNSQIGVPLSVWLLEKEHEIGVFEAGISQPGEMVRLWRILRPQAGILTNIGKAHAAAFTSDREKLHEKLELFKGCKVLIFRYDGGFPAEEIEDFCRLQGIVPFSWGQRGRIRVRIIEKDNTKTRVAWQDGQLDIPFTEESNVENALHVATMLHWLGWSLHDIQPAILELRPLNMRLSVEQGIRGTLLINDAYSSDPESFRIALGKLAEIAGTLPKTAVITDFEQVKSDWDFWQEIIQEVRRPLGLKRVITIGSSWKERCANLEGFICLDSTEDLIQKLPDFNFHDEVILFKGARRYQLERVIDLLNKQTHQTWVEVSLDSLHHNLSQFRKRLPVGVRIMLMLKAAAYGSGESMAYAMRQLQADYVGVAYPDEGFALRRQGYVGPVMVMHVPPSLLSEVLKYQLEPVIHSEEQWQAFLPIIRNSSPPPVNIHIEVDTGMHRLGFPHSDREKVLDWLKSARPWISVRSVFSHFSGSDEPTMDSFTQLQWERFQPWVRDFKKIFGEEVLAHIANSAATARFPQYVLDMVRLGIGFYGYGEMAEEMELRPSFSWNTTVISVNSVPAGEPVGYGKDAIFHKDRTIAVLSLGYADGFSRKLGHGNWVFKLPGGIAPTVGRVCMDMLFVDVTDINVKIGDQAMVFHEGWGPLEMARRLGTIPYEILTGINLRVRRIMIKE
jgi:alanine racemase